MPKEREIIFVLCHTYTINEGDQDLEDSDIKNLYYSHSREECKKQIPFYRNLPGFVDYPDGFEVMHIPLDERGWETGFVRW